MNPSREASDLQIARRLSTSLLRAVPLAFDYAVGCHEHVDRIVEELIEDGFNVFLHYWPEADLNRLPRLLSQARRGRNDEGFVFRVSMPDSYIAMSSYRRRVAINVDDHDINNLNDFIGADKTLCLHPQLAFALAANGIRADLLSFSSVVRAILELSPFFSADDHSATVSVVIPSEYDIGYLTGVIDSVRTQVYPGNVEIVVANYGPNDKVPQEAACGDLGATYVCVASDDRASGAIAANHGLDVASGSVAVVLDDRAMLPPYYLFLCLQVLSQVGTDSVILTEYGAVESSAEHLRNTELPLTLWPIDSQYGPAARDLRLSAIAGVAFGRKRQTAHTLH